MLRLANSLLFKLLNGLAVSVFRFVVLVIAARVMAKDDFGVYSYVINFAFLAVALANLGLPTATARGLSATLFQEKRKDQAKGVLMLAAQWRMLVTIFAVLAFIAIVGWLQIYQEKGGLFIWLLAAGVFFFKSFDVWFEYTFAGMQEYRLLFLGVTFPRELLRLLLIGILLWWGMSSVRLVFVDGSVLAFSLIVAIGMLFLQFRHVAIKTVPWRPFIGFALSIAPTSVIALAYERINVVILGRYVPMSQVAEYNAAYQFTALAILLVPIGTVVVLPTFMSMTRKRLNSFVNQIIRITLMLLLPVFFGLQIFGKELLALLYGNRYVSAAAILGIFAFLLLERIISPTLQNVLLAFNRPKTITVTMTVGGVVNIILAIWLVQKLGAIGPAIALVIGRFLVLALLFLILSRDHFSFQYRKFASITAIATVFFLGALATESIIIKASAFLVGLTLYGYVMARFIAREDVALFLELFRQHRHDWRKLLMPPEQA